jgi:Tol biopolymer transport system component
LVAGDTNNDWDVFVHDRNTHQTAQVSVDSSGEQGNSTSWSPSLSADGRTVAFWSTSSNLVVGDTNGNEDVFVHDRLTKRTTQVSVDSSGAQGSGEQNGSIAFPQTNADGRYVAFISDAADLVVGDTNNTSDVFVRDRTLDIAHHADLKITTHQKPTASVRNSKGAYI